MAYEGRKGLQYPNLHSTAATLLPSPIMVSGFSSVSDSECAFRPRRTMRERAALPIAYELIATWYKLSTRRIHYEMTRGARPPFQRFSKPGTAVFNRELDLIQTSLPRGALKDTNQ